MLPRGVTKVAQSSLATPLRHHDPGATLFSECRERACQIREPRTMERTRSQCPLRWFKDVHGGSLQIYP